jgi:hypothetical protein
MFDGVHEERFPCQRHQVFSFNSLRSSASWNYSEDVLQD